MKNATTRQVLNELCTQLPFDATWELRTLNPKWGNDYTLEIRPFKQK
jgi:hypothetical protein